MLVGIILGAIIGYKIDGKNKRIVPWLFGCFAFRFIGLFVMTFLIDDYKKQKWLLVGSFLAMQSGTFIQAVTV